MAAKQELGQKMWRAANKGDVKTLRACLDSGADPDHINLDKGKNRFQRTALHLAAQGDHPHIAHLLLDYGASIELADSDGDRPLHLAASYSSAVTRILLDKGAAVNVAGDYQQTPLHCSAQKGNAAAARLILGCGRLTALLAKDSGGDTALDLARREGHEEVASLLEEAASGGGASAAPPTDSTSVPPHTSAPPPTSARENELEEKLRQMELKFDKEVKDKERLKHEHAEEKDRLKRKSGIESAVYELPAKAPGRLVIFANSEFERWGRREGTEADIARLRAVFKPLGFTVLLQEDLTGEEMRLGLQDLAEARQQARFGSVIVVVLSHGDNRGVLGVDGQPVPDSVFYNTVGASKTLQGKPKLFFLQACRGSREQGDQDTWTNDSVLEEDEVAAGPRSVGPDMLVVKSSIPEHVSKRHQKKGSLFVQQLCDVVEEEGRLKHVEDLVKSLTQKMVAVGEKEGFGACPSICHNALTKRFFLVPRH